jgi:hypothetical protein
MSHTFKPGDSVRWNSEAGMIDGQVVKVHTADIEFRRRMHRACRDELHYRVRSDKTGHEAMHKGPVLEHRR